MDDIISVHKLMITKDCKVPWKEVDVIISEWMGYLLLYENMLEPVIIARDRWLKKDGILMPDMASIYLCGLQDAKRSSEFWSDVYGFDFSAIKQAVKEDVERNTMGMIHQLGGKPRSAFLVHVEDFYPIVTDEVPVVTFDLQTMTMEEVNFTKEFKLTMKQDGTVNTFVASFDVQFTKGKEKVILDTGCNAIDTHWKQACFNIDDDMLMKQGDEFTGRMQINQLAEQKSAGRDLPIRMDEAASPLPLYHAMSMVKGLVTSVGDGNGCVWTSMNGQKD